MVLVEREAVRSAVGKLGTPACRFSTNTIPGSSRTTSSAALSGIPFFLKYEHYARWSTGATGVSGWISWGGKGSPKFTLAPKYPDVTTGFHAAVARDDTVWLRTGEVPVKRKVETRARSFVSCEAKSSREFGTDRHSDTDKTRTAGEDRT